MSAVQLTLFDDVFGTPKESIETEMIEKVLLHGSGFVGGKERIKNFVLNASSISELAKQIKTEYRFGGWITSKEDGQVHWIWHDDEHFNIKWMNGNEEYETTITWVKVAQVIKRMVERGIYA